MCLMYLVVTLLFHNLESIVWKKDIDGRGEGHFNAD